MARMTRPNTAPTAKPNTAPTAKPQARKSAENATDAKARLLAELAALDAPAKITPIRKAGKTFTFSFSGPSGHVSTAKTLVLIGGRGKSEDGIDVYIPLHVLAREIGYLPEEADITITVTPKGGSVENPLCVIPSTMKNQFSDKTPFSEVYAKDGSFSAYLAKLAVEGPAAKPARTVKEDVKPQRVAAGDKTPSKSEHGAASSLADTVSTQGAAIDQLAALMLRIVKKVGA